MYKAIIFDLDGTLLDTLEDIGTAANTVLQRNGFPPHPIELYREFVGEGARRLIERALPAGVQNEALVDKCLKEYIEEYGRTWTITTRPYAGIQHVLEQLTLMRVKLAILSNKTDVFTKKCAARFFPTLKFDVAVGESKEIPPKPDPKGAFFVAQLLHRNIDEILYAGDSGVDMKTARKAGMFAVGVSWGFRPREELEREGADIIIDHPEGLLRLLDEVR